MSGQEAVTLACNQSSATNSSNSTQCETVDTSANVPFLVIYSLLFLAGTILNGFTLKVYFCRPQQMSSTSVIIYLKNLAAADFLISLCLPIRIMHYASGSSLVHQAYCNFGAAAYYLNMYASIMFMGYIAANRYLKIVFPLGTHILQTVRAAHIISTVTWVFLLLMTCIYITLSLAMQEDSHRTPKTLSCDSLHSKQLRPYYILSHVVLASIFLITLGSLVFFYSSTSRKLVQAQQKHPLSSSSKNLAKSRRNMLVLVVVFCICFVPYHLVRLPYSFLQSQTWFYLKEVAVMLSVLNVCLDPLIYFIFCEAFRAQMRPRAFSITQYAQENTEMRSDAAHRKSSMTMTSKNIMEL